MPLKGSSRFAISPFCVEEESSVANQTPRFMGTRAEADAESLQRELITMFVILIVSDWGLSSSHKESLAMMNMLRTVVCPSGLWPKTNQ